MRKPLKLAVLGLLAAAVLAAAGCAAKPPAPPATISEAEVRSFAKTLDGALLPPEAEGTVGTVTVPATATVVPVTDLLAYGKLVAQATSELDAIADGTSGERAAAAKAAWDEYSTGKDDATLFNATDSSEAVLEARSVLDFALSPLLGLARGEVSTVSLAGNAATVTSSGSGEALSVAYTFEKSATGWKLVGVEATPAFKAVLAATPVFGK